MRECWTARGLPARVRGNGVEISYSGYMYYRPTLVEIRTLTSRYDGSDPEIAVSIAERRWPH